MELPENFDAAIFDCDGTLADTMPLHLEAWQRALAPHSLQFEEDLFYQLGGVPSYDLVGILNDRYGIMLDPRQVCADKERAYETLLPSARPIQEVVDLVKAFSGRYPLGVASGGLRSLVVKTLDGLGIRTLFQVIATAEDVERGKPEPDLFLFAASKLNAAPERCVVYEDSPLGLEAARRAGMLGIDIRPLLADAPNIAAHV